jgi:hypothetical protein
MTRREEGMKRRKSVEEEEEGEGRCDDRGKTERKSKN